MPPKNRLSEKFYLHRNEKVHWIVERVDDEWKVTKTADDIFSRKTKVVEDNLCNFCIEGEFENERAFRLNIDDDNGITSAVIFVSMGHNEMISLGTYNVKKK